jgi:hypothetical protein
MGWSKLLRWVDVDDDFSDDDGGRQWPVSYIDVVLADRRPCRRLGQHPQGWPSQLPTREKLHGPEPDA